MRFETGTLKTGVIAKELLVTRVDNNSCYALLTTGRVIQFECYDNEQAVKIQNHINQDSSYQMEKTSMGFSFVIIVHQNSDNLPQFI